MEMYVHTVKGINNGCLSDRLYLCVPLTSNEQKQLDIDNGRKNTKLAWKVDVNNGTLYHPAFGKRLTKLTDQMFARHVSGSNSQPTAIFHVDSYYRKVTFKQFKQGNFLSVQTPINDKHITICRKILLSKGWKVVDKRSVFNDTLKAEKDDMHLYVTAKGAVSLDDLSFQNAALMFGWDNIYKLLELLA